MIAKPKPSHRQKSQFPSPAEIARAAEKIRRHWSTRTLLKRSGQRLRLSGVFEMPLVPRRKGYSID